MRKGALTALAIVLGVAAAAVAVFSCTSVSCTDDSDGCGDDCEIDGTCDQCSCAPNDQSCVDECYGVDAHVADSAPFDAGPLPDAALYPLDADVDLLGLDAEFLYWIDQDSNIVRAPKDGSSAPVVISSQSTQGGFALGNAGVYYLRLDGKVAIIPYDGGPETVFAYPPAFPDSELPIGSLAVDNDNLYYAAPSSDVVRAPLDGGTWLPTVIGYDAGQSTGTYVYVQNDRELFVVVASSVDTFGKVFAIDKTSGAANYLFTPGDLLNLQADDSYLYVSGNYPYDAGVQRVQDDGGLSQLVANGEFGSIALDDASVYAVAAPLPYAPFLLERIDKQDGGVTLVANLAAEFDVGELFVDDTYVYALADDNYDRIFIARFPKTP